MYEGVVLDECLFADGVLTKPTDECMHVRRKKADHWAQSCSK